VEDGQRLNRQRPGEGEAPSHLESLGLEGPAPEVDGGLHLKDLTRVRHLPNKKLLPAEGQFAQLVVTIQQGSKMIETLRSDLSRR
jgi:hypothetical protein